MVALLPFEQTEGAELWSGTKDSGFASLRSRYKVVCKGRPMLRPARQEKAARMSLAVLPPSSALPGDSRTTAGLVQAIDTTLPVASVAVFALVISLPFGLARQLP